MNHMFFKYCTRSEDELWNRESLLKKKRVHPSWEGGFRAQVSHLPSSWMCSWERTICVVVQNLSIHKLYSRMAMTVSWFAPSVYVYPWLLSRKPPENVWINYVLCTGDTFKTNVLPSNVAKLHFNPLPALTLIKKPPVYFLGFKPVTSIESSRVCVVVTALDNNLATASPPVRVQTDEISWDNVRKNSSFFGFFSSDRVNR